jgi:hypothetical protein
MSEKRGPGPGRKKGSANVPIVSPDTLRDPAVRDCPSNARKSHLVTESPVFGIACHRINAALDSSAVLASLSSVVSSRIATRGPRGRGMRGFF